MMKRKYAFHFIGLAIVLLAITRTSDCLIVAQTPNQWNTPQSIPNYDSRYPPFLVADKNRTVHAFNSQKFGDDGRSSILYRRWTVKEGWTTPNDIFLSPAIGLVEVQGVYLDQFGIVHLAFYVGNPPEIGKIYYSQSPVVDASRAPAWSEPKVVGNAVSSVPFAAFAGDDRGKLTIVFSGYRDVMELLEVHSTDSGDTWSEPAIISRVYDENYLLANIQLLVDRQGHLHAVWSVVFSSRARGEEIHYARLDVDLMRWSKPIVLAAREGNDYAVDFPSIIEYKGELIVMFLDGVIPSGVPPTQWMRRSGDGGQSWTEPIRPFPHVGGYGSAALLVDNHDILHILVGNRIGDPAIYGMWHGVWLGDRWSELELITDHSATVFGAPSRPKAVVSQGNVLLGTWWHDDVPVDEFLPAAYSYSILDAPELPVAPFRDSSTTSIPVEIPTLTETPLTPTPPYQTPRAFPDNDSSEASYSSNPAKPAALSAILVVSLIAIVIIGHRLDYFGG